MKFLLDTNVISESHKNSRADAGVVRWLAATPTADIATSVIVLGEIRRGIELKRRRDRPQARVMDRWYETTRASFGDRVLPIDEAVALAWARLDVPDPMPAADGLICATALVHGLTLVTRNVADFARRKIPILNPFTA